MTTIEKCEPLAVNWPKKLTVSHKSHHHIETLQKAGGTFIVFISLTKTKQRFTLTQHVLDAEI